MENQETQPPQNSITSPLQTPNPQSEKSQTYPPDFISEEEPTSLDIEETEIIESILKNDYNLFESENESRKRQEVIIKLDSLVKKACENLGIKKGLSPQDAHNAGGKLFSFGSYRLGVVSPGDDLDVLCVGPDHCDRDQFYDEMEKQLRTEKDITQISPVKDANVPIIKIIFSGIPVDILVARLNYKTINENLTLEDDNVLRYCSGKCILSLNGCRVTNAILSLVPDKENFKLTLRVIKLWAKKRGIYGNVIGYPGGVAWAILVAKVCQMFPKLKPNKLIRKFFNVYANWNWEEPVKITELKKDVGFKCEIEVWKPKDDKDKDKYFNVLTILTPAFPSQNTNYNTTETTKRVLIEEFIKFDNYTKNIIFDNNNIDFIRLQWHNLFNEIDFFKEYNVFLQIDILATTLENFKYWDGLVESRLRFLITGFLDLPQIKLRPYTKGFQIQDMNFQFEKTYFYGIDFNDPDEILKNIQNQNKDDLLLINVRPAVKYFISKINEKRKTQSDMNVRLKIRTSDNLPIQILQMKKNEYDMNKAYKKRKLE